MNVDVPVVPCDDAALGRAERAIAGAHMSKRPPSFRVLAETALHAAGEVTNG